MAYVGPTQFLVAGSAVLIMVLLTGALTGWGIAMVITVALGMALGLVAAYFALKSRAAGTAGTAPVSCGIDARGDCCTTSATSLHLHPSRR
jgi:hypothetical protein